MVFVTLQQHVTMRFTCCGLFNNISIVSRERSVCIEKLESWKEMKWKESFRKKTWCCVKIGDTVRSSQVILVKPQPPLPYALWHYPNGVQRGSQKSSLQLRRLGWESVIAFRCPVDFTVSVKSLQYQFTTEILWLVVSNIIKIWSHEIIMVVFYKHWTKSSLLYG